MTQDKWLKQMFDFNKTAFDNAFSSMATIQEQAENAANTCFNQAVWMPQAGKTAIGEWMKACRQAREGFKNSVDDGFKKVESCFVQAPKSE